MTNRIKIIISLIVIIVVGVAIFLGVKMKKETTKPTSIEKENEIYQYFNETDDNNKENEVSNTTEIKTEESTSKNENSNYTNSYVGKEEQESGNAKEENKEMTDEEKAISLAKKAWGSTASYYNFEAIKDSNDTNKYVVKVRNKSTTQEEARYYVDIKTEKVTE